jgi:hypothetical protein
VPRLEDRKIEVQITRVACPRNHFYRKAPLVRPLYWQGRESRKSAFSNRVDTVKENRRFQLVL